MVRELRTEIIINGSAENVWSNLMDFESFPEWNPFIQKLEKFDSEIQVGTKLKGELFANGNKSGFTIKPKVVKYEPNKEFRWLGHMGVPRLFDGEHIFEIETINESQVRFIHREKFRGLFVRLILKFIGDSTKRGFENMNRALKERVEQAS